MRSGWLRGSLGTALLLSATGVVASCGSSNSEPKALAGDTAGPVGSGGATAAGSGGAFTSSATSDTGGSEAAAGASGAPQSDVCSGTALYEATWTEAPGDGPGPRLSHAMVDVPGGVLLFGGGTLLTGGFDDTWLYEQGEWRQSDPSTRPPVRAGHAMVFDDYSVILFGGDGGDLLNDMWRFADDQWDELCTDDSCGELPTARSGLALSYDQARGKLVLFGGFDGDAALQDTWEWDADQGWQQICGDDCASDFCCEPDPRHDHRMVYDSLKQRVLMFGGTNDDSEFDDVWAYDGTGWHEVDAEGPSPRAGHTFAFDPTRGLALLFGGMQAGSAVADAAWIFDSRHDAWAPIEAAGAAPVGREFAALAFDQESSEFVMFGGGDTGQFQDTWTMSYELASCLGAGGAAGAAGAPGDSGN
jgi:hypothetical protein